MSEPATIPEWVATLVGSLVLENTALRRSLAQPAPAPVPTTEPPAAAT